jgi:L-alanine-DL-glutamate epimerase-like enolase superfamily enzyme
VALGRELRVEVERWPLRRPFRIAGGIATEESVVTVSVREGDHEGRGEASGVYYRSETAQSIEAEIEALRDAVLSGINREELAQLLPSGGARNALDCALWALEARIANKPAWLLAGLDQPRSLTTTVSIGADSPDAMAAVALDYPNAVAVKLKLLGDSEDAARVQSVRAVRPDVWLGVDANQSLGRVGLEKLLPTLVAARVELIEQPVRAGEDEVLEGLSSPIPLAADESVQGVEDLPSLRPYYRVINIKLDKTGGLTAALSLARTARKLGFDVMVGNMCGTSLAMAPAFLVGQLCRIVDLDGPLLFARDREQAALYSDGQINCLPEIWA